MKKTISLLVIVIMCCLLLCSCISKSSVIGVWSVSGKSSYMYIYQNGTGDIYSDGKHANNFTWKINGEYVSFDAGAFWGGTYNYTIDGDKMYDAQGKCVMSKVSDDTTKDR